MQHRWAFLGDESVTTRTGDLAVVPCTEPLGLDGTPSRDRLGFEAALVTLVGNALNLRYVGTPGLETLVDLAASVPVHTIAYCRSGEAVGHLRDQGLDS